MRDYTKVFKAYDIRAVWGEEIDAKFFYACGYGVGKHLIARYGDDASLVFGADTRVQNTEIIYRFLQGVQRAGKVACVNAGLPVESVAGQTHPWGCCSTAMLYWIAREQFSLGISFTASHNPAGYVWCKMVDQSGQLLPSSVIASLIDEYPLLPERDAQTFATLVHTTHHRQHPLGERVVGRVHEMLHLLTPYVAMLTQHATVVVDCASGTACAYEKQLLTTLTAHAPLTCLFLNTQADGLFTAHGTDTTDPKNFTQLGAEVQDVGAICGMLFDGDADRLGAVDEQGKYIPGDILAVGLVDMLLQGAGWSCPKIVYDVSCTQALPACVERHGGKAVPSRIGHRYIKEHFDAHDALAGVELSGHLCFQQTHGHESPLLALLLLLQWACQTTMSAWLAQVAPVCKPPLVNLHVADASQALQTLTSQFAHLPQDYTDGVRVSWADRWFLVRASNTEPILRIYIEAPDMTQYDRLFALIQEALRTGDDA